MFYCFYEFGFIVLFDLLYMVGTMLDYSVCLQGMIFSVAFIFPSYLCIYKS